MDFRANHLWMLIKLILIAILLGACRAVSPTSLPISTTSVGETPEIQANPTLQAAASPTPSPMPTETQEAALVVLLAPQGSDPGEVELLRSALEEPIRQAGLSWEIRSEIDPQDAALKLVIALPPDIGIAKMAASAPQVQFVAVGIPGLQPAANLSLVGGEPRYDRQGFMAGVIAAMITPDWRVGVVSLSDTPEGKAARNGFMNGAIYFCGLCQAYHGPIFDYPLYVEIPSGAGQAELQAALDSLTNQAVKTVYVSPGIAEPSLLESLAQAGINIIGSGTVPQNLSPHWVTSVDMDLVSPLLDHLPEFLAGSGCLEFNTPIVFHEVNQDLFSPGKQKLAESIREEVLTGMIDSGVDPLTGENR